MKDSTTPLATDVVAAFAGMAQARRAIDALQYKGHDGARIAIRGAGTEATQTPRNTSDRDSRLVWRVIWRGFIWSVWGAVIGIAAGFAFSLTGLGPEGTVGLAILVAGWAMFFHILGALYGAYTALASGPAWEMTFAGGGEGRVYVVATCTDQREIDRAVKTLREQMPLSLGVDKHRPVPAT